MKKFAPLEILLTVALLAVSLFMMLNGYIKVSKHMEVGKNEPLVTNYKHADKEIKANMITAKPSTDVKMLTVDQPLFEKIYLANYRYQTNLSDTTLGADMDGHLTEGKTKAVVKANYDTDTKQYMLYGVFTNMPKLREGYYYEAWLVRKKPFSMISAGKIVLIDGEFSNVYASEANLLDHTFFVVTLEGNDGNTQPGMYLLEGEFKKLN